MRLPATRPALTGTFLALGALLLEVSPYALLVMLPALLLAWVVALGWFTGEHAIAAVRRALRRAPRRAHGTPPAGPRPTPPTIRGGLLVGRHLASRPPPLAG